MRRLPKMAAALLAAALAVSAALPALAADQRAELELEASVRCTGEAADETLTVRLTALDGAPMPEGCDDEAELDFPARDCRDADDKTLTKTFDAIVYTAPGIYEYTVTQDAGGRKRADYDDTVFYLKVMVAWDTDGELKGHVSVRRDGDDGAKAELLFKNSYRSTDPLPPPVTPPYVPDKPTPTPKPVKQPGEITVIRPPTPSAEMPDEVTPAAEPEPVSETPASSIEREYLGVLTIPALGLELPVQTEWSKANLKVSPCRQCGSTAGGDLVIAAHNYKSHFGRLSSLSEGDEVRFTSQDGAEAVYTVERTAQVSPEEPEALREGDCPLVLYTCTPDGKARVVVYCQRENAA